MTLKFQGMSLRCIAKYLNCSPSTVGYELKRGTNKQARRERNPIYKASRGYSKYLENRTNYHRPCMFLEENPFIIWTIQLLHFKNGP